jgi:hypothetical protein
MKTSNDWGFAIGAILVLTGAFLQIGNFWLAPYITGLGALLVCVVRLADFFQNQANLDFRQRRLKRIQMIVTLLLPVSAYLMYIHNNAWALALFLVAFFEIYILFRWSKQ